MIKSAKLLTTKFGTVAAAIIRKAVMIEPNGWIEKNTQ